VAENETAAEEDDADAYAAVVVVDVAWPSSWTKLRRSLVAMGTKAAVVGVE
jgi:hypothetical protein